MVEDKELVRQYASTRSESAFAELVNRHLKMVYAAAVRQVNGDSHLAEDVTQTVFTDLAGKAGRLGNHISIAGWLYASTRFAAANAVRAESRRRAREETVAAMIDTHPAPSSDWNELRPVIDEALAGLGDDDRDAIVLRFFESLEFARVGSALGISESGARMRVERALEKLRGLLQQRGFARTNALLGEALAESSALVVPSHLAAGVIHAGIAHGASAAASSAASTTLKLLVMKKITLAAAVLIGISMAGLVAVKIKSRSAPASGAGVRVVTGKAQLTLARGERLALGGWPSAPGKRLLVFINSGWIDSTGAAVLVPGADAPRLYLDANIVEIPDSALAAMGLAAFGKGDGRETVTAKYSDTEFKALLASVKNDEDAVIMAAPRLTTRAGMSATVAMTSKEIVDGKPEVLGPSLGCLAKVSADGLSMDLALDVTVKTAATQ